MTLLFLYMTYNWFGTFNPTAIYTNVNLHASPVHIVSALLFDSMRGIIVNNPVALLVFVGLPIWFRYYRASLVLSVLTLAPSMALLAIFNQWQGGDAPIGRYTIDFLPVFMPAIGLAIAYCTRTWQKVAAGSLVIATLLIALDFILTKRPYIRGDMRSPLFAQLQHYTGFGFDRFLPTFSMNTTLIFPNGAVKIALGYILLLGLLFYGYRTSKTQHKIED